MRTLPFVLWLLLALCVAGPDTVIANDASPKPSDTNNQPAKPSTPPPTPPQNTTPKPQTPSTSAPAPSTPAPAPSTPAPAPSTPPPSSSSPAPTNAPTAPPTATPEPTTTEPAPLSSAPATSTNTSSAESESSGMGAGAIVGIVLACVGLVGIIGFFAYRHFRARREDAKNHNMEYGGPSPVPETARAYDDKLYAALEVPKATRQTTATATPTDDIVVMTKYATPSSPKFTTNAPQLSPPPFENDVADFTKSVANFDQSRGPNAMTTEFAPSYRDPSYREGSYAESYNAGSSFGGNSYAGGGSFVSSFDHGMLTNVSSATDMAKSTGPKNTGNNDSHWMDAMDEMRDTNDSYAMLEAGGSFNSRGSAMRFSTDSDIRG